jgi:hypothetical protein
MSTNEETPTNSEDKSESAETAHHPPSHDVQMPDDYLCEVIAESIANTGGA